MVASSLRTARVVGIGAACAASVAVGIGLVFKLVTPASLARLGTAELVGLLGLLVLPGAVLAAVRAYRHADSAAAPAMACSSSGATPARSPGAVARRIVVLAPDVRDATGTRHRRRRHAGRRVEPSSRPARP